MKKQGDYGWRNGESFDCCFDYPVPELFDLTQDDLFHIGQSYQDEACKTYFCVECGSKDFNVGNSSYFTAIRCIKCGWEQLIHDG